MYFQILGPLRVVTADGRELVVSRARPRALLGALLLRPNQHISTDWLHDVLYYGERPRAGSAVRTHVWQLRRLGLGDRIHSVTGGYRFRVERDELDFFRFDDLVQQGRNAFAAKDYRRAVSTLTEACHLWREPQPSDLPAAPVAREPLHRLAERRVLAEELCIDARLALGEHREVLTDLSARVPANPSAEHAWRQLMVALYRCGRKVEALQAFDRLRGLLRDEYGLDPSADLRRVQEQILASDPALGDPGTPIPGLREAVSVPESVPNQLPPAVADFTGRAEQLRLLLHHLVPATGQERHTAPIVSVTGAPGTGKSMLAVHAAHRLRTQYPDGQLYADLAEVRASGVGAYAVLERFLRALGDMTWPMPRGTDELAAQFRSRVAGSRILLVLDNVTDECQVSALLPGSSSCACIVTTAKLALPPSGTRRVDVGPFESAEAIALLRSIVGHGRLDREPRAAEAVVRACGHLPAAVRLAGQRLVRRPHWSVARLARRLDDHTVRVAELDDTGRAVDAILEPTYRKLANPYRETFHRIGETAEPCFTVHTLAARLNLSVDQANATIDAFVDAGMLEIDAAEPDGQTRFSIRPLLHAYAYRKATAG